VDWLIDPQIWASLLTLTALEIVLGIDNLVFITILAERLPAERQNRARQLGLALALVTRLALLGSIAWIVGLTQPLFEIVGHTVSWRDLILIGAASSCSTRARARSTISWKATCPDERATRMRTSFGGVIVQIVLLDIVFSLDRVITAVGMANEYWVMATAIVITVLIMLGASGPVSGFVNRHPTVKMLALSFLLLVGMALVTDGAGLHVPKGYIYTAIGFSVMVEALNQLAARRRRLRTHPTPGPTRLSKRSDPGRSSQDGR
jgi:predicted tellurium resistance membrane protein TerC